MAWGIETRFWIKCDVCGHVIYQPVSNGAVKRWHDAAKRYMHLTLEENHCDDNSSLWWKHIGNDDICWLCQRDMIQARGKRKREEPT